MLVQRVQYNGSLPGASFMKMFSDLIDFVFRYNLTLFLRWIYEIC